MRPDAPGADEPAWVGERLELPPRRPTRRADAIAQQIRDLIAAHGLRPGDRIPQEWLSEAHLQAAKGTVREALKALKTQGLIKTRTGPGGGVFVSALSAGQAMDLLSNLFLFSRPSLSEIYALRKLLEPELVAGLAGRLDEADYAHLQETIRLYDHAPADAEEEFQQRLSELDFHSVLAGFSDNRLLTFACVFLHRLLREMAVCRAIYATPNPQLRETALNYQVRLMRLLKVGDAEGARSLMAEHMAEAERYMLARAAIRQPEGG
ncbi:FadR/GntR family transcriptional regulator [Aquibaculum arenosum]|uniref:FCD domain-containing protein n=1 Tax=Aquibaculum arenosum TaxID=3032591 RepID=A0ABT5YI20_9PROT|nr:FCD domain-containing protein [Fodinicurvata sp. CAU 1616]MDF2094473.1 FCD domain-containing protein [Fodinicurvata sp. CAU 1616]